MRLLFRPVRILSLRLQSLLPERIYQAAKFLRVPILSMLMMISSPRSIVKSLGGTMPVPVIMNTPRGKLHSINKYPANSICFLFILLMEMESENADLPCRLISSFITAFSSIGLPGTYKQGPSAAHPSYTFA